MLKQLNDANFHDEVRETTEPVVVMYSGSWCEPCKKLKPDFEFLADQLTSVKFMTADVEENAQSAQDLGIRSVPSFALFLDGMVHDVNPSVANKADLRQWINDNS